MLLVILGCYCNSKWPDEKKWLCTFTETNHDGQHTLEEKREKYNLTVLSNSYWSPFLLPFENIINLVCVSVWTRACVSVCVCACMLLLLCAGKFKGVYLCVKPLVVTVIFWQAWHKASFQGPNQTECYSSLVFYSLHSGSECPAPISLSVFFTFCSPITSAHLSCFTQLAPAVLSLHDTETNLEKVPLCVGFVCL